MDLPAIQLLCLEQQDPLLEDHTRDFIDLACFTHFPDCSLCVFFITSVIEQCKARLPADGPNENFATCVEWVLETNALFFSACTAEENSSPTPDPEPSQPSPSRCTECSPEPTSAAESAGSVQLSRDPAGSHQLSRAPAGSAQYSFLSQLLNEYI